MTIMTDNVQVDSYRHLDLSPGGDIVKGLLAGVPAEADGLAHPAYGPCR